ncbi:type I polyketide synthase [Trichloromonas acetexigens]|uniref:Type I polyketide synthase n=1 Tax=Trichloromonas acetexigens TaxID=38815 RepID=A0A550JHA5_9BACT|nr:type I polyketide synthase [Desulfuromonas acetexigens]TRO82586.1 type I polyketide synthase [Desulfuromonas acetexigens]
MKTDRAEQNVHTTPFPPLAIVGLGCLFPKADNVEAYWSNIKNGVDAIREVPESHWRAADYFDPNPKAPDKVYAKLGGFLDPVPFNPMDYGILPNALEAIDTSQLLGLVAVGQALKDAGYGPEREFDREKVSVILGVTGALELVIPLGARLGHPIWRSAMKEAGIDDAAIDDAVQRIGDAYVPWQENSFPGLLGNVVAGRISKHYNFGGTNCVCDAACGSSLSALNLAALELATGQSDMVVTGGIDTFNDIFMYTCFSKTPALSPSGHARPFDADGDGTTLGEGLGILVLKRLTDAERDGDKIYAVVKGIGTSSDGKGSAIYEPSPSGQQKALRRAYENAGVEPATIGLIEAHGTGTRVGDAIEVKALREVFGDAEQPTCALGSVKSQIGHTKAAAGSAGLIKTALALHHKVLPPTIKVKKPQDAVTSGKTPFYINNETRPWLPASGHPRRAAVSALGFGGSNFHCVLEEYRPEKATVDWSDDIQIAAFSAADNNGLEQGLKQFPTTGPWSELARAARTSRRNFDPRHNVRLALVFVRDGAEPAEQVRKALAQLEKNRTQKSWTTPDGICFASGEAEAPPAVLFPGQGAQYPGMLKELALHFPAFFQRFEEADRLFPSEAGPLSDFVYPRPAFTDGERQAQSERLRATEVAQPALGAVSLGAWSVLADFGLSASAFAGHSYGELTALCAAGVLDAADLHRLSRLRGELMAAGSGDKGSMLAVSAPLAEIEKALEEEKLNLVLANRNTPEQGVLSGPVTEIQRAAECLGKRGLRCTMLNVAAAFHSELVADAAGPFAEKLKDVAFRGARTPVYANTSGAPYPADAAAVRDLLANQLAKPVEFVQEIEALYAAGIRVFLEVGPGARLTGMVKAILGDRPHQALAIDAANGKRSALLDLARALAQLAVLGQSVSLDRWDDRPEEAEAATGKKAGLTVSIGGANYFKRPPKRPAAARPAPVTPPTPAAAPVSPAAAPTPVSLPAAAAIPTPAQPSNEALREAMNLSRQGLQALQNLQEQTARLHQQFLTGQEQAVQSFLSLVEQQRRMFGTAPGTVPAAVATPTVVAPASPPPVAPPVTMAPPVVASPIMATTPAITTAPGLDSGRVAEVLLAVIAEKTGYPREMLDLDMALDADLGIDSIKRVEILSALQEQLPEAPTVRPDELGVLQTLGQIVERLAVAPSAATPVAAASPSPALDSTRVAEVLLAVIAEKTGYPREMLELDMALDADLGIDSIKRVEILSALQEQLPDAPPVRPDELGVLQTLGQIVERLAVAAPAAAMTVAAASPAAALDSNRVAEVLLAVIAEKTGYPREMLELDMALDADLGIDSIKRVEILSALQEQLPDAPPVRPDELGVLQTLGQIVERLAVTAPAIGTASAVAVAPGLASGRVAEVLLAVIAEKTGYPREMLELDMALDADLGIDSIKRVEILSALQEQLPEAPPIKPEHLGTLQTVAQIVDFLASVSGAPAPAPAALPAEPVAGGSVERQLLKVVPLNPKAERARLTLAGGELELWIGDDGSPLAHNLAARLKDQGQLTRLIPLDELDFLPAPSELAGLILLTPVAGCEDRDLLRTFRLMQIAGAGLNRVAAERDALFVTVSRLNGSFGLSPGAAPADPLSGGLAGLSKTAAHEWPKVHCKAIDLADDWSSPDEAAAALAEEILRDGPREVGLSAAGLHTLKLTTTPLTGEPGELPLSPDDLVVVSGGARGVTAEVAIALARAGQATFLLLGRSSAPEAEPEWLRDLQGETAIKQALLQHAESPLKPKDLETRYQSLLHGREIRANLRRIEEAGGRALYRSVDLRDCQALARVIAKARDEHGPVRGLIHGAGVLADRHIADKTLEQFEMVYATKIAGLRALLDAVGDDELRFMALFSSSTGRFGRTGQVDYAVANEVLNKIAQQQARLRPHCRVLSLNWGPWDGGMVTPGLKKLFAQEGVEVIGLQAGADYLIQELATPPGGPVELVILGTRETAASEEPPAPPENIHVSKAFDLDLSVAQYPFLQSHVMDKKAVLPMAMMVEWLAQAAIHNNPGLRFHGFNDLRVMKGVTLGAEDLRSLQVLTGKAFKSDGFHVVPVELSGRVDSGRPLVHTRAKVVLANRLPAARAAAEPLDLAAYSRPIGEIYRPERLFHGADFQGLTDILGCSEAGISARAKGAPAPGDWIAQPLRNSWLADPLVLDCAFQLMILWSFERYNAGSLPVFTGRYRQYAERFPEAGCEIRIQVTRQSPSTAAADMEFVDPADGRLIARIEDYECVIDASLNQSFQRNKLQGAA